MEEEPSDLGRIVLKHTHIGMDFVGDIFGRVGELTSMYGKLQPMIEIFIRIIFRGIRGQEKDFDLFLMLFQPDGHQVPMMHFQIIQNQEYLLSGCADQSLQKLDEPLLIHRPLIDHEPNAALFADGREHVHPLPLCLHRQDGGMSFGRKATFNRFTIADPCLISPIDDGVVFLGPFHNRWVFRLFPPLDALRILFYRALRWTLAAHSPAFHIIRYTPGADFLPVRLFYILSYSFQRP